VFGNVKALVALIFEPDVWKTATQSPARLRRFGRPMDEVITLDHSLGRVFPVGRNMTGPRTVSMIDRNGQAHASPKHSTPPTMCSFWSTRGRRSPSL